MATELDLAFTHVDWEFDDLRLKAPEFIHLNPAGAIPTIVDDGFALSESLAINLYLAQTYGAESGTHLHPNDPQQQAEAIQWSLWVQGHIEPWVQKDLVLREAMTTLGKQTTPAISQALGTLDQALARTTWLLGERFTVADLNVASVLSPSRSSGLDFSKHANVRAWLSRCYARPAALAARAKFAH